MWKRNSDHGNLISFLSAISQLSLAYHYNAAEELITSFRCNESEPTANGWSFGGANLEPAIDSVYCPSSTGPPCYFVSLIISCASSWNSVNSFAAIGQLSLPTYAIFRCHRCHSRCST